MIIPDNVDVLEELIIHLATLYDQGLDCVDLDGDPVSDPEYDLLIKTLKNRNPNSIAFAKGTTSPSKFEPTGSLVIHNPPMTSIAKADGTLTQKVAIYEKWVKDCCADLKYEYPPNKGRFAQSYKHDGVAVRIYYKDGKLEKAGLRPRNGVKGIDVTENIKHVKGIAETLPLPLTLAIGGELECLLDDYEEVQKALIAAGEEPRKNPRNHTYGGVNQRKDPTKTIDARISFCGYSVIGLDNSEKYYKTEVERAKWVNQTLKINFVQMRVHKFEDLQVLEDNVLKLQYEVDGIVLKVNNLEDQEQLGNHGDDPTGDPHGALAWKFAEEHKPATVKEIEWNASRTGKIPPVAVFETGILLAGTIVTRATCSNLGWLTRMGIGPGTVVDVYKAGKIIPKIDHVISGKFTGVTYPLRCPACHGPVNIVAGAPPNEDLVCLNKSCAAKHVESIAFFLKNLDAKGLGTSKIEELVSGGKIKDLADLYSLQLQDVIDAGLTEREAILALATIHMVKPQKDNDKLKAAIEDARKIKKLIPAWQFFAGLGIKGSGKTAGKALFEAFGSFDVIRNATEAELLSVNGIGDIAAPILYRYFRDNLDLLDRLLQHIELELPKVGKLTGTTFVLSGSFDEGKVYWEKQIQDLGGKISSSVGNSTNYLVAGPGSGSKSDKAIELGIKIINVDELKKLL